MHCVKYKKHMDKLHVFTCGVNLHLAEQIANCKNNAQLNEKKKPKCTMHHWDTIFISIPQNDVFRLQNPYNC